MKGVWNRRRKENDRVRSVQIWDQCLIMGRLMMRTPQEWLIRMELARCDCGIVHLGY